MNSGGWYAFLQWLIGVWFSPFLSLWTGIFLPPPPIWPLTSERSVSSFALRGLQLTRSVWLGLCGSGRPRRCRGRSQNATFNHDSAGHALPPLHHLCRRRDRDKWTVGCEMPRVQNERLTLQRLVREKAHVKINYADLKNEKIFSNRLVWSVRRLCSVWKKRTLLL